MDFSDVMKFATMPGQSGIDQKLITAMLDVNTNLETKNLYNEDERNMLILLLWCDREFGCDIAKSFNKDFSSHQLSHNGFNRSSLERMAGYNPTAPQPSVPAKL